MRLWCIHTYIHTYIHVHAYQAEAGAKECRCNRQHFCLNTYGYYGLHPARAQTHGVWCTFMYLYVSVNTYIYLRIYIYIYIYILMEAYEIQNIIHASVHTKYAFIIPMHVCTLCLNTNWCWRGKHVICLHKRPHACIHKDMKTYIHTYRMIPNIHAHMFFTIMSQNHLLVIIHPKTVLWVPSLEH